MTIASQKDHYATGVEMAKTVLSTNPGVPIFAMDENAATADETQYAIGWNSVWASEENKQRFSTVVIDPKAWPGEAVPAQVRAFVERNGCETNYLRLNHAGG